MHERGTAAAAGTLFGVSHTLKAGALSAFEFLRVVVKGGAVATGASTPRTTAWIDGGAAAPASRQTFPMARERCEP